MQEKIKKSLKQIVQQVQQDMEKHKDKSNISYHLVLEDAPDVRISVLYRQNRFVVSVHYVKGPNRGKTLARIVEFDANPDNGNYFNEDWLYPEAGLLQRMR